MIGPEGDQCKVNGFLKGGALGGSISPHAICKADDDGEGETEWDDGHDVDTAEALANEASHFTKKECTFQKMEHEDFHFQVGQKIAILVFRDFDIAPEDTGIATIAPEKILEIFGKKGEVNIHTGEIKRVVEDGLCFKHDINAFEGCSGSIMFLLDQQPDGVGVVEEDHGKAIALHVGGNAIGEGVDHNFAFKIQLSDDAMMTVLVPWLPPQAHCHLSTNKVAQGVHLLLVVHTFVCDANFSIQHGHLMEENVGGI